MSGSDFLPFARKLLYFGAVAAFMCAASDPSSGLVCVAVAGGCLLLSCVVKAAEWFE